MTQDVRMRGFSKRDSVETALQWIKELNLEVQSERIPIDRACGRILAEDVISNVNVPGFRRSMMDGFAVKADDVLGADTYNPISLKVVGEIYPGQPCTIDIQNRQAVQVMTGAPLPDSADAVVPVEYAERNRDGTV